MKKRSALMVAGGLVGALLSAVAGYSIRLTWCPAGRGRGDAAGPEADRQVHHVHHPHQEEAEGAPRERAGPLQRGRGSLLVLIDLHAADDFHRRITLTGQRGR